MSGFVIFTVLGYMAEQRHVNVEDVARNKGKKTYNNQSGIIRTKSLKVADFGQFLRNFFFFFYHYRPKSSVHHLPRSHCQYDGLHVFRHHLLCDDDHTGIGQHGVFTDTHIYF